MKKFLIALSALALSCGVATASERDEQSERNYKKFLAYVSQARINLAVPEKEVIYVGELDLDFGDKVFSATTRYYTTDDKIVYVVMINDLLLEEVPDYMLETFAYHEVCHIALNHFSLYVESIAPEILAERCVLEAFGKEKYALVTDQFKQHKFQNPILQRVKESTLVVLRQTIAR